MDSALILLLRMRFWGWFRRIGRKLGTAKGILLTGVGVAFFAMMFLPSLFTPMPAKAVAAQHEGFVRFGPFGLLLYCLLILLLSPGDKAFAFTPAEVSMLFPAPFTRRQLLAYKIGGNLALTFLSGFFLMFCFRQYWSIPLAGYLGVVLMFSFLQLFQIGATVAGQAIGAAASTWRRRLALALIVAIVGGTAYSLGTKAFRNVDLETLKALEHAPAVRIAIAPFQPFTHTLGAARIWPDVVGWGLAALAINAAMIGVILAMDAQYLEAAATSSERFYAKLERMRKGGPSMRSLGKNKVWKGLSALPWWGGVGPIAWRQLTAASRDYLRVLTPVLMSLAVAALGIFLSSIPADKAAAIALGIGAAIVGMSLPMSMLLTFDFRGDFEQMEGLKTLPIRPFRLVAGQLFAPVAILTGAQVFALIVLAIGTWPVEPIFWAYAVFAPVLNLVLLQLDNLMFLLFPSRPVTHTPGDVQALGRVMLLMFAKMFVLAVAGAVAGGFAFVAYWVGGAIAALAVGWLVLTAVAALLMPLVAAAFVRYDVASESLG